MKRTELISVLQELRAQASPDGVERMARFGVTAKTVYGIETPVLKAIAKRIGKNH